MKDKVQHSVMDDPSAFRRQVRMSAVQTAGLARHEIEMALAYEVEPVSGIPASEAEVAFRLLATDDPTVCVYEVSVRRRSRGKTSSGGRAVRILAAAGIAVLCAVAVDAVLMFRSHSALGRELECRKRLDEGVRKVVRAERAARAAAERLRASRRAAAEAQGKAAAMRSAWHGILGEIASSCGGKAVLTEISSDAPFRARIKAVAVSPQAAADVMAALSSGAGGLKWRVVPGSTVAGADDATAVFECGVEYD